MTAESHPWVLLIGDPEFLELAELAIPNADTLCSRPRVGWTGCGCSRNG